jgi:hypothetical protein
MLPHQAQQRQLGLVPVEPLLSWRCVASTRCGSASCSLGANSIMIWQMCGWSPDLGSVVHFICASFQFILSTFQFILMISPISSLWVFIIGAIIGARCDQCVSSS